MKRHCFFVILTIVFHRETQQKIRLSIKPLELPTITDL